MNCEQMFRLSNESSPAPTRLRLRIQSRWVGVMLMLAAGVAAADPGTGPAYEGPVGVTGIFNGNVTTGCSYDPISHSAQRTVTDLVVPGAVGKYPLQMTRTYNSRAKFYSVIGSGPGWTHEYNWLVSLDGHKVISPQGSVTE
jgi:hypothetical protein